MYHFDLLVLSSNLRQQKKISKKSCLQEWLCLYLKRLVDVLFHNIDAVVAVVVAVDAIDATAATGTINTDIVPMIVVHGTVVQIDGNILSLAGT